MNHTKCYFIVFVFAGILLNSLAKVSTTEMVQTKETTNCPSGYCPSGDWCIPCSREKAANIETIEMKDTLGERNVQEECPPGECSVVGDCTPKCPPPNENI